MPTVNTCDEIKHAQVWIVVDNFVAIWKFRLPEIYWHRFGIGGLYLNTWSRDAGRMKGEWIDGPAAGNILVGSFDGFDGSRLAEDNLNCLFVSGRDRIHPHPRKWDHSCWTQPQSLSGVRWRISLATPIEVVSKLWNYLPQKIGLWRKLILSLIWCHEPWEWVNKTCAVRIKDY